ncbi:hypothetical protein NECAME_14986, partial [Necator americanus]
FDEAEEYSLYIENEDGVRLKPVGNKLVEYDKYDGPKSTAHLLPQKITTPLSPNLAQLETERHQFRKAVWSYLRGCTPRKHRSSLRLSTYPDGVANNGGFRRTTFGPSIATEPIEETPESETTTSTENANHQEKKNDSLVADLAVTPKSRLTATGSRKQKPLLSASHISAGDGQTISRHSAGDLSLSSFSEMEPPAETSTPMQKCAPQAHSTPFETDQAKPFGLLLEVGTPTSPQLGDSFEDVESFVIPEIPSGSKSDNITPEEPVDDISNENNEEENLAAFLQKSMELSSSTSGSPTSPQLDDSFEDVESFVIPEIPSGSKSDNITSEESVDDISNENNEEENLAAFLQKSMELSVFACPKKLGEGVYGEVFATTYKGNPTALKVSLNRFKINLLLCRPLVSTVIVAALICMMHDSQDTNIGFIIITAMM